MLFRDDLHYILSTSMAEMYMTEIWWANKPKQWLKSEGIMGEVHYHNHCKALLDDIFGPERNPAVECLVHTNHILQEGPRLCPQP